MSTVIKTNKKKKILKIIFISITALMILFAVAALTAWNHFGRPGFHSSDVSQLRTMDFSNVEMYPLNFSTDALYLVRTIERTHPIFLLDDWLPDDYEAIRDEFLSYVQNPFITSTEFAFAVARYITALRDGHMTGFNGPWIPFGEDDWRPAIYGIHFNVNWAEQNGQLFLLDEHMEITDSEVIAIGGAPVSQIFATVDRYYYSENEADRQYNRSLFSRFGDVIERAGGEITNDSVELTLYTNGASSTVIALVGVWQETLNDIFGSGDFIIRYEMIDDIFVIDLRTFVDGPHITEVVQSIESAVENGTRKFIVDLRGNGGGTSIAGQRLLEPKFPQYLN